MMVQRSGVLHRPTLRLGVCGGEQGLDDVRAEQGHRRQCREPTPQRLVPAGAVDATDELLSPQLLESVGAIRVVAGECRIRQRFC